MAESELKNFDKAIRNILSITSNELKDREENWKKEHGQTKAGRKAKPLASAPVSCVQV